MEMNSIRVRAILNSGDHFDGEINIMEYKRFSDFIENHGANHIKLFNIMSRGGYSDSLKDTFVIPKKNILYYEPFDGKGGNDN